MITLPAFTQDDVKLLITAVEQALKHLRDANERQGGNDAELLEYGRRYSLLLEKLTQIG